MVLYDVSTLYFEVGEGDGFRESGFSKERRLASILRAAMNMGVSDLHVGSLPVPGVCGQAGEPAVAPADGFRVLGSCGQGLRRVQAGQGAARSRANAAARWVAQGQSRSSLSCQRRPVRTSRPAMLVRR